MFILMRMIDQDDSFRRIENLKNDVVDKLKLHILFLILPEMTAF